MMYHHKGYGGIVQPPDSDLAVDVEMRNDNDGPHSVEEITKIYADLRKQFPHAQVTAANLSEIAAAIEPYRSHTACGNPRNRRYVDLRGPKRSH